MAYKTFANGFPLPASDLNNFLMNQSVIVFADAAARTTAIPSPVEGMLTYLEDTNAYESWNGSAFVGLGSPITTEGDLITGDASGVASRIAIGTADQVLTVASGVPAWADASGGGGDPPLTLLASGSIATGAAATTISGLSGHDVYFFYYTVASSGTGDFYAYLNGTTSGKSVSHITANNGSAIATVVNSTSYPTLGSADGYNSVRFAITVRGGSHTGPSLMTGSGGSIAFSTLADKQSTFQALQDKGSAVFDSITILAASGTFFLGTYEIYGG